MHAERVERNAEEQKKECLNMDGIRGRCGVSVCSHHSSEQHYYMPTKKNTRRQRMGGLLTAMAKIKGLQNVRFAAIATILLHLSLALMVQNKD